MKQKLFSLFVLGTLLFSLPSCDKDEFQTEGELNAEELQTLVEENSIVTASIYVWSVNNYQSGGNYWKKEVTSKPFEIKGPYIVIDSRHHYSLARLEKFSYEMIAYREGELSLYLK